MSLFNLISGDPLPVNPNPQGSLLQSLLAMPQQQPQAPAQSDQIMPGPGVSVDPRANQDLWQPTHRNFLGRLGDAMLIGHGLHPVYEQRMREKDLASAMQGYDPNNPTPTIQRIAQIPGMADQAYKMFEQVTTDKERDESRGVRNAAKKDLIFQRLGGMAGAATEQNYPKMQQLMTDYVKRWGEDPADYGIPDSYDKDALDALSGGSISAKDQAAAQTREDALALRGDAIQNTADYRKARLGQIDTAEEDRNSRFSEGQDRQDRRHDNPVARPRTPAAAPRAVKTPQGMMELSPSGLTGKIGDQIWQKVDGNQWKRIK